jgi:2,3-bisphosphoglycerate-independent phosphoglycerate mutase
MMKPLMLIILDGWGHGKDPGASAIAQARTPCMNKLYMQCPNAELLTHSEHVGLPPGQMGNSEVGHLNIGAGRIVYQELARINQTIANGSFAKEPVISEAFNKAAKHSSDVHLMGLVSDGGVHSHIDHLKALCDIADQYRQVPVYIHAFLDGRDTDPRSGLGFIRDLLNYLSTRSAEVATVVGRYYAMDRDKRWERTKVAYDLLTRSEGLRVDDLPNAIEQFYTDGKTDEFMPPIVRCDSSGTPMARIKESDSVIFFNFRTDRPRQLTHVLTQPEQVHPGMQPLSLFFVTMTEYDATFDNIHVVFERENLENTLGEVISASGLSQLRIAETEKYPHVTYFFSGGREDKFAGEKRLLIPSPKVATYDLQPEMSAREVTDAVINELKTNPPAFVCLNFANPDMVGHTGVFQAAVKAVETVDNCLDRILQIALKENYDCLIIADHGNADFMINPDGSPNTAHTKNPVPVILVSNRNQFSMEDGILADVAPTILHLMGLEKPAEMTGRILVKKRGK